MAVAQRLRGEVAAAREQEDRHHKVDEEVVNPERLDLHDPGARVRHRHQDGQQRAADQVDVDSACVDGRV